MRFASVVEKDLILAGGGHAHVAVLKSFAMRPVPGLRITLVSKESTTAYSGMLPGLIAGHYSLDEIHLDLRSLCRQAGAQFYQAEIAGLDPSAHHLLLRERPPAAYDLISINTGSTPSMQSVPGAVEHAIPAKPVREFLHRWERLQSDWTQGPESPRTLTVVGGGAGGVELLLSMRHRLLSRSAELGRSTAPLHFQLITASASLLPTHNRRVQTRFERWFNNLGITWFAGHRVLEVTPQFLLCEGGRRVETNATIWVTQASAPDWIRDSGLATDEQGFIAVNPFLQSTSHPDVFAAGDVAAMMGSPRPKSGVFAVRQGRPLAANLRRALDQLPLRPYVPQQQFLSLISTGDRQAVGSRGPWSFEGEWVWKLKDHIDRAWMAQYEPVESMNAAPPALQSGSAPSMRCGGCGAKIGPQILDRVLARLRASAAPGAMPGLDEPDDAAVILWPSSSALVQTVDYFRNFLDDPYLFGRIAALHALGDIFAMGAEPRSVLAIITLPPGRTRPVEEQLYQVLAGALATLGQNSTKLLGGHTSEGIELSFGLAVNGEASPHRLLKKGGMRPGDRLILTKPIGTGVVMAASMRGKAHPHWIDAAIAVMLVSNRDASRIFLEHSATACTDITGFGLAGHLREMAVASRVTLEIHLQSIPLLLGALDSSRRGIASTLFPENLRQAEVIQNLEAVRQEPMFPLLFDPQTSGGLIASVPPLNAQACLDQLQREGYREARDIGEVASEGASGIGRLVVR
ncbi:MAG: selenide, water dikinase SelD [Verrucomicrobia bacterium]|nr:selenide, water dikinase SelD [Verrucomicrobiota bacterium]